MKTKLFAIILFTALGFSVVCSQNNQQKSTQVIYPLTGHPRLFFLDSDTALVRAKIASNATLTKVYNTVVSECNKMLTSAVPTRVLDSRGTLGTITNESLRRLSSLCFIYRMTGDVRYAQRAESEMLALAKFTDWNGQFLDVADIMLAMAIGYDWLYNYLSPISKKTISSAIKSKGIDYSCKGTYATSWWWTSNMNWGQVCNGGLAAGCAAVYEDSTAYYKAIINACCSRIKISMDVYKDNGSYPEGYSYWGFGTEHSVLLCDMMQKMFGTDNGVSTMTGFLNTGTFMTHIQGNAMNLFNGTTFQTIVPEAFNFCDAMGTEIFTEKFWLSDKSGDSSVLYEELQNIQWLLTNSSSTVSSNKLLPFMLIWSANLNFNNLVAPVETSYICQGKAALAAFRTGWGTNDIYFGLKGGTPTPTVHGHMDVGSFIMEANGVRWAMDFGKQTYGSVDGIQGIDLFSITQTSKRWDLIKIGNQGHNTLIINGNKQLVNGTCGVENVVNTADLMSAELNLTSMYSNDVSYLRRKGAIVSKRYVQITDSVKAAANPITVRWNMVTRAIPVRVSNKIIKLTQSSKVLYLIFDGTDSVDAKMWSTQPKYTIEDSNVGITMTGFEYTVSAGATQKITVKLVPDGDPILAGLDLTGKQTVLSEDFESFSQSSLSNKFSYWMSNPYLDGTVKAIMTNIAANPNKSGINTSNQVLKIQRQDDTNAITASNASSQTFRGVLAYGYDVNVNANSIIEFKYLKDTLGKIGIRVYDGKGNALLSDYVDSNEGSTGYSTAQWRTAQFPVGKLNLSSFSYTPAGYLLISVERNTSEAFQQTGLIMYIDDIKMLPLPFTTVGDIVNEKGIYAFYDSKSERICVANLPDGGSKVYLFDIMGHVLQEVDAGGNFALMNPYKSLSMVYIVRVVPKHGIPTSIKVLR